ncbi:MAG: hypothetical protein J1F07_08350 [Muribaculaceae bacterium]|nr:hypothetical protein [Muribaculaceae bacterium]
METVLACFVGFVILVGIASFLDSFRSKEKKEKNDLGPCMMVAVGIGMLGILVLILYVIGWIWYYFCCGFLVMDDGLFAGTTPFWDRVIYGFMSVIFLGIFLSVFGALFGWIRIR